VLEITLKNKSDYNSIIQVEISGNYVETRRIWVPVIFVGIGGLSVQAGNGPQGKVSTKGVYPSKLFRSPTDAQKVIENL
jgi:hypothetical protein